MSGVMDHLNENGADVFSITPHNLLPGVTFGYCSALSVLS